MTVALRDAICMQAYLLHYQMHIIHSFLYSYHVLVGLASIVSTTNMTACFQNQDTPNTADASREHIPYIEAIDLTGELYTNACK